MRSAALVSLFTLISATSAYADINVVTSIKPVHSLVASVMQGHGTPHLLVQGGGSPHTFNLKPSDAQALQDAEVVFFIGHELEAFLVEPLKTLAANATVTALDGAPGITLLSQREGGSFDAHGDEDHAHEDHEHEDNEDHDHEEHDHDDDAHADHAHGEMDLHIWLDPQNAKAMTSAIAQTLANADPENAAAYTSNAEKLIADLDSLTAEITAEIAPVKNQPFIVFHDGYQYFESRFGLSAAGSITVSPENLPGAQRIAEIHEKIQTLNTACVFAEPQFEPKLVQTVIEGTNAKSGVLDPLGADIEDGPTLYPALLRQMATAFTDCLGNS